MIEFIIPLNLPVRAIELTAMNEGPSIRLRQEIASWARQYPKSLPSGQVSPNQRIPIKPGKPADLESSNLESGQKVAIEQELELLRAERARLCTTVAELARSTKQVEQQMPALIRELEVAAVELAHAIAAKLVFEQIENDRFPIENLIHEVVGRLESTVGAVVRLHPDDLALVQEIEAIGDSHDKKSLKLVPDQSLARGDCKAKAGEITVVYELRRQIEEIRRELLSTVGGHAET